MQSMMVALALAGAQAPILYDGSVEGWQVFGERGFCLMQAEFEGGTTLAMSARADRQGVFFHVKNPAWKSIRADQELKLDVEMDRRGEWPVTAKGVEGGAGFIFERDEATNADGDNFVAEFALSRTMRIVRGGIPVAALSLKGTRAATLALFECRARLRSAPDFDPFADPAGAVRTPPPPAAGGAIAGSAAGLPPLFSDADYPPSALRAGEQGTVRYRLDIGADGRVSACTITASSGSAALDSATCRLLRFRARFKPARDSAGRAVAANPVEGAIHWRLPPDEEPVEPPVPAS